MSLSGNRSVAFMPRSRRPGLRGIAVFSRSRGASALPAAPAPAAPTEGGLTGWAVGSAVIAGGYAAVMCAAAAVFRDWASAGQLSAGISWSAGFRDRGCQPLRPGPFERIRDRLVGRQCLSLGNRPLGLLGRPGLELRSASLHRGGPECLRDTGFVTELPEQGQAFGGVFAGSRQICAAHEVREGGVVKSVGKALPVAKRARDRERPVVVGGSSRKLALPVNDATH